MVGENNHSVARRLTALTAAICTLGSLALVPMANAADGDAASGSAPVAAEQQGAQQSADQPTAQQSTQQQAKPNASDASGEKTPEASAPAEQQPAATGKVQDQDGKQYDTIADAIKAGAKTVTLVDDLVEKLVVEKGTTVTLDLNGHVLKPVEDDRNSGNAIINKGILTITDSSKDRKGTVIGMRGLIIGNYVGGVLTVESGNYIRRGTSYAVKNYGTMTINGGVFKGEPTELNKNNTVDWTSTIANGWYDSGDGGSANPYGKSNPVLNIHGGEIIGGIAAVKNDEYGIFNMDGGTLIQPQWQSKDPNTGKPQGEYTYNLAVGNNNVANITGGRIFGIVAQYEFDKASPDKYTDGKPTVNIGGTVEVSTSGTPVGIFLHKSNTVVNVTGGTYTSGVPSADGKSFYLSGYDKTSDDSVLVISGGKFNTEVPRLYTLATGDAIVESPNGGFTVVQGLGSATSLTLTSDSVSAGKVPVLEGASVQLHAKAGEDAKGLDISDKVTWTSSDTKVATVDASGKVTGVAKGEATMLASITWIGSDKKEHKLSASIKVTVYPKSVPTPPSPGPGPTYVTGLTVSSKPNKVEYRIGEQFDGTGMVIKYQPSNGSSYVLGPDQYTVTLDTSKPGKVKVFVTLNSDPSKATSFEVTVVISDVKVHRLYNPRSGEHFYVSSENEYNALIKSGQWRDEGIGFTMVDYGTPVYRLYNPGGKHLFTTSVKERDVLIKAKWNYEGVAFYVPESSDGSDDSATKVHRLYNPGNGDHLLTTSANERGVLVMHGWRDEGTAFTAK